MRAETVRPREKPRTLGDARFWRPSRTRQRTGFKHGHSNHSHPKHFTVRASGSASDRGRNLPLGTARAAKTIWEARTYSGELVMRLQVDDLNSLLRAPPLALRGDTMFVISMRDRPYPVIGEIVLERSPS